MRTVLAADLGGTKCKFALVGSDHSVHGATVVPTQPDRAAFLLAMDQAFDQLRRLRPTLTEPPHAIGLGAAGVVRVDHKLIENAPNLPVEGFALAEHLEQRHGLPAVILNDGRASAWGEYLRGHAAGSDPLLVLFFGTGIGIGLMVGGAPYRGAANAAGEVGHTIHVPDGRVCACGRSGCFEAYCGGGPMTRRAREEIGAPPSGERWTVSQILARSAADPRAQAILQDAERAACAMVASLCTLLNPAAVVLGGGVLRAWPQLRDRIEAATRAWCTPAVTRSLKFVPSLGESDAILWGAAAATARL